MPMASVCGDCGLIECCCGLSRSPDEPSPSVLLAMSADEKATYLEFRAASKAMLDAKTAYDAAAQRYRAALEKLSAVATK